MANEYTNKVKDIIFSNKPGWVFSHVDFESLNNLASAERVLSRLVETNEIKRIRRGLYYLPELSRWGEVPPSQAQIVAALSRSMKTKFLPDGANALYQLGLTTQIPMKQVYITDKQISNISIGKASIEFRKVASKKLSGYGKKAGVYLSAIEHLGKQEAFQKEFQERVASSLNKEESNELQQAAQQRAAWIKEVITSIIEKVK